MENLENITTVSDLLKAQQSDEDLCSVVDEEDTTDFDKGKVLLDQIRELSPDVWLKVASRLVLDASELHRNIIDDFVNDGEAQKASNWAYDTAILDMAAAAISKVKL